MSKRNQENIAKWKVTQLIKRQQNTHSPEESRESVSHSGALICDSFFFKFLKGFLQQKEHLTCAPAQFPLAQICTSQYANMFELWANRLGVNSFWLTY